MTEQPGSNGIDWAADYDIFDPDFVRDPYPIWSALRTDRPLAHTERRGGSWMPVRYEDIQAIAQDSARFSSREITVAPLPATVDEHGNRRRSIIATDPPEHTVERRLFLPFFAPRAVERYRVHTEALCHRLLDALLARAATDGAVDAAEAYARQIPPRIIALILGIDPERADEFTEWVQGFLEFGLVDRDLFEKYRALINEFFAGEIAARRLDPGDDLISWLLAQTIDGEPYPEHLVAANVNLMLIAGIDTTWSSIGSALWHLAAHPDDTARLVADPSLLPVAVEELLRAYSPVTMARIVAETVTLDGHTLQPGDRVLLPFAAANRDPAVFERPDEVLLDRAHNRHVAFGSGIHRCVGSNLARMEMNTALRVWLERIPRFRLADPDDVTWAGGQVRGPRRLRVVVG
jgi:cytochrome P450